MSEIEKPPVPHAKVAEIAACYRELRALHRRQAATQAKLIRGCVHAIRRRHVADPGWSHLSMVDRRENQEKRKRDADQALLHLEWLATRLEDQSVSDDLTPSTEGNDDVHGPEITP